MGKTKTERRHGKKMKLCNKKILSVVLVSILAAGLFFGFPTAASAEQLIPGGESFGVKFLTKGSIVVGTEEVQTDSGGINPAEAAGIQSGDIILEANGSPVESNEQLSEIVSGCKEEPISITVQRNQETLTFQVCPAKEKETGEYRLGLWIRDNSAGVGTVTFYYPGKNTFGALGHGICDIDTGVLLPLRSANVFYAEIFGLTKGQQGTPGKLKGMFLDEKPLGNLYANTEEGIFGKIEGNAEISKKELPTATSDEICQGPATILCTVDESGVKEYNIEIIKINRNPERKTKNLLFKVTDPELLEKTGGIVQGMSGSPILQNGKIAGAVTHVLVNDPTKGYGIFIENMLEQEKQE